jgi:hypothetical protein
MVTVPRDSSVSLLRRGSLSDTLRPPKKGGFGGFLLTSSDIEDPVELMRLLARLKSYNKIVS